MDFLQLENKSIVIFGAANRKSVAWHIGRVLTEAGRDASTSCKTTTVRQNIAKLLDNPNDIYLCDVEREDEIVRLRDALACAAKCSTAWSIPSHSPIIPDGVKPFHETPKRAFLQAVDISCYSLVALGNAMKELLTRTPRS